MARESLSSQKSVASEGREVEQIHTPSFGLRDSIKTNDVSLTSYYYKIGFGKIQKDFTCRPYPGSDKLVRVCSTLCTCTLQFFREVCRDKSSTNKSS